MTLEPPCGVERRIPARRQRLIDAAAMAVGLVVALTCLDPVDAVLASVWWIACVVVIRSDLEDFIIPDLASAVIAGAGLADALAETWPAAPWSMALVQSIGVAAASALLRGAAAFALFWLIARVFAVTSGREGLGFGDVKLAGACAIWLDFADQAAALEIAALAALGLVLASGRRRQSRDMLIPFGAFLAPAGWLVFVLGPVLRHMIGTPS